LTSDSSLRAIVSAVLTAAAASLEVAQLVHVVVQRFPAAAEPEDTTIDHDTFDRVTQPVKDDPGLTVELRESAREVYDQLSPSQRALLPYLERDSKIVMQVLHVGRSRAYEAVKHVRELLDRLLPDDETRGAVCAVVISMCREM
jgi:hypothetical protein